MGKAKKYSAGQQKKKKRMRKESDMEDSDGESKHKIPTIGKLKQLQKVRNKELQREILILKLQRYKKYIFYIYIYRKKLKKKDIEENKERKDITKRIKELTLQYHTQNSSDLKAIENQYVDSLD